MFLTPPDSCRTVFGRWSEGDPAEDGEKFRAEMGRGGRNKRRNRQAKPAANVDVRPPGSGAPEGHSRDIRLILSDQWESFTFLVFSIFQAVVLGGLGVLAGWLLPIVHASASEGLTEEQLNLWDHTHHNFGRFLKDTFLINALVLLGIGVVVIAMTVVRSLVTYILNKQKAPTSRTAFGTVGTFARFCGVSALLFASLGLVSMLINIITAWPLAWLLPQAPKTSTAAGYILSTSEEFLLLAGLLFGYIQNVRSAISFIRRRSPGSGPPPLSPPASGRPLSNAPPGSGPGA